MKHGPTVMPDKTTASTNGQDISPPPADAPSSDNGSKPNLIDLLRRQIAADGPISVADFMGLALGHPTLGYYTTRDPLGAEGDFITAPEISQMFGELIGLWCAQTWIERGRPGPVTLVELGPGRGTLMADMLRALAVVPDFRDALTVRLVETSPVLRERQAAALSASAPDVTCQWHGTLAPALEAAEGFTLVVANEFFDALPIRQFVKGARGWHERMVALDDREQLSFCLSPDPLPVLPETFGPSTAQDAIPEGTIREWGRAGEAVIATIAETLTKQAGAALVIDYGPLVSGPGDTLQAVRRHAFHPPLETPGNADLTAHVDFQALMSAAKQAGASPHGPLHQGPFLEALGIAARAEALAAKADEPHRAAIGAARDRLTAPRAMGTLFKVLALTDPGAPTPPAFASMTPAQADPEPRPSKPETQGPEGAIPQPGVPQPNPPAKALGPR